MTRRAWWMLVPAALAACGGGNGGSGSDADADVSEVEADVEPDVPGEDGGGDDGADVPPEVPPRICNEPVILGRGPYFSQATLDVDFGRDQLHLLGVAMVAGDIDGDEYPDLIVHQGQSNARDDPTNPDPTTHRKRVLLNRPRAGGGRTFEDATVASRYGETRDGSSLGRVAQSAVFGDVDNDGDLDVVSLSWISTDASAPPDPGDRTEVLLNDGTGVFSLAAPSEISPGPTERWSTNSVALLDYDRDGALDVFLGSWYRVYGYLESLPDRLYRGAGDGTFTDVTEAAGLMTSASGYEEGLSHRPTFGVTACDIDGDGDDDLAVSVYGRQWNLLWENLGDGTFRNVAPQVGFDSDDELDYTDNQFYRCYCQANPTVCTADPPMVSCADYWQPGVDDQPWQLGGNTFSTACADADDDGDMDLFNGEIRHWWAGGSSDPSGLLENVPDAGELGWTLRRVDLEASGLARTWRTVDWNEGDLRVAFVDFDNDGRKDVYVGSTDYPDQRGFLFHRLADGTYEEIGRSAGVGHPGVSGMAWADFDRDGDLDLVVGSATMRDCCGWTENEVHYYRNEVGQDGNWLQVELVGDPAAGTNRSAIGARVSVTAGGRTQVQELQGGYGHGVMQHDLVLHFGLDAACDVDVVEVRWPDAAGTAQRWEDLRGNYRVRLVQGSEWVYYRIPS